MKRWLFVLVILAVLAVPTQGATTAQISVGTTAILLCDAVGWPMNCLIRNAGTASIFIGGDSSVTTSTGIEIVAGAGLEWRILPKETLYGIVATGTQRADVGRNRGLEQ